MDLFTGLLVIGLWVSITCNVILLRMNRQLIVDINHLSDIVTQVTGRVRGYEYDE